MPMACARTLGMGDGGAERRERGRRREGEEEEEEGLLTAATTRRNEEERPLLLPMLLPLQLAPAALEARQAAVAIEGRRSGEKREKERREQGEGEERSVSSCFSMNFLRGRWSASVSFFFSLSILFSSSPHRNSKFGSPGGENEALSPSLRPRPR